MKFLVIAILPLIIYAKSHLVSTIPVPKTYIQLIDPYECDINCLDDMLKKGMIFSFLSHTQGKALGDDYLKENQLIYTALFNLGIRSGTSDVKIAVVIPHKIIGRYAASTTNAVFAYLLAKNHIFDLKIYQIEDESYESISSTFSKLSLDGYSYVIAPFTFNGVEQLSILKPSSIVYIPTINHELIETNLPNIYFGGISYKEQIKALVEHSQDKIVMFYNENSKLGSELNEDVLQEYAKLNPDGEVFNYAISKRTTNLKNVMSNNEKIIDSSIFLNTPLVKSSMILSQTTLYEVNATNKLTTQINYDPLLLTMTQYDDRKDLIIANSIGQNNNVIVEANELVENDITYDWINYSTTVGIDMLYNMITGSSKEYSLNINNQQIMYDVKLMRATVSRFKEL
ncbi:MAG: hypothetical protein U9N42_00175 [Campylobacterota bacterium]|nr:hypothetical protein [Campylobacterota bacterium]